MPVSAKADLSPETLFEAADFAAAGQAGKGIIAAVSGGGDSLALLLLLQEFLQSRGGEKRLLAITIDHNLRAESAAEAEYVAALCRQYGIRHQILRREGPKPQSGVQAAARQARYRLLAQAAEAEGAAYICAAHTADDQIETYFMRRQRLAAPISGAAGADTEAAFAAVAARGLACMARRSLLLRRFWLARPLLSVNRADLRACLTAKGVKWIDDPSNVNNIYERTRIRQSLTQAQRHEAEAAIAQAARARRDLSSAAARLGGALKLRREGESLALDLAPLHKAEFWPVSALAGGAGAAALPSIAAYPDTALFSEAAALYLLLAAAAAVAGGKDFIAPADCRLQKFALYLLRPPVKGEKPQRISVCGAVLEKRWEKLTIRREKRGFAAAQAGQNAGVLAGAAPPPRKTGGLFDFIVPGFDEPLFALFAPLLPDIAAAAPLSKRKTD